MVSIYAPWKYQKVVWFSDVFREYRRKPTIWNGLCNIPKGNDTLWKFPFRAFHEIQFQGHFMKHEILSWNTFTLISSILCVCFSSIKKIMFTEKRYRVKFNSIKNYLLLIKQKQKYSKIPKHIWMRPCSKTRSEKSECANIFLELPLTI